MDGPPMVGDTTKRSLEVLERGQVGTGRQVSIPTSQIPESVMWKSWNGDTPSCFTDSVSGQILEEKAGGEEGMV